MSRAAAYALAADLAAVILFVAIGRRSHDEPGNIVVGAAKVAAPFLIGVGVAWLVARLWRDPLSARTGVTVWLSTVVIGMLLRHTVFDRGTATAFIIVTTVTLALFVNGWRLFWRWRSASR